MSQCLGEVRFREIRRVGEGRLPATVPMTFSADETTDVGYESGGYRWLGLNIDNQNNLVGFDGQMSGLNLTFTLYR